MISPAAQLNRRKKHDSEHVSQIGGGASIVTDMKELEIAVSLSYKFSGITAQNGTVDWSVLPLDALVFYRLPKFRFGGGLTYHLSPQLKGSGGGERPECEI